MARRDERNRTKYWCSGRLPGVSLLQADFTRHDYAPHTHDTFVVALTELGGAEIRSGRVVEGVEPSILLVSNPEELQSARMGQSTRWCYRALYAVPSTMELIARRLDVDEAPWRLLVSRKACSRMPI